MQRAGLDGVWDGEPLCVRDGCCNMAVDDPGWDTDYCSNECVVRHCRLVWCLTFWLPCCLFIGVVCVWFGLCQLPVGFVAVCLSVLPVCGLLVLLQYVYRCYLSVVCWFCCSMFIGVTCLWFAGFVAVCLSVLPFCGLLVSQFVLYQMDFFSAIMFCAE